MKITTAEIEAMLEASPGATADGIAVGFERRAARLRAGVQACKTVCYPFDMELARLDDERARALRAYAAGQASEMNRLLESAQRAGDNATARAIVQACEVLGLETIGGGL